MSPFSLAEIVDLFHDLKDASAGDGDALMRSLAEHAIATIEEAADVQNAAKKMLCDKVCEAIFASEEALRSAVEKIFARAKTKLSQEKAQRKKAEQKEAAKMRRKQFACAKARHELACAPRSHKWWGKGGVSSLIGMYKEYGDNQEYGHFHWYDHGSVHGSVHESDQDYGSGQADGSSQDYDQEYDQCNWYENW